MFEIICHGEIKPRPEDRTSDPGNNSDANQAENERTNIFFR